MCPSPHDQSHFPNVNKHELIFWFHPAIRNGALGRAARSRSCARRFAELACGTDGGNVMAHAVPPPAYRRPPPHQLSRNAKRERIMDAQGVLSRKPLSVALEPLYRFDFDNPVPATCRTHRIIHLQRIAIVGHACLP